MPVKLSLEELVTTVASDLMGVTSVTLQEASQTLLKQLVQYFDVDLAFLRENDHEIGATILVAEWPPREHVPDPDPVGTVYFANADPVFAATEHLSSVMLSRPGRSDEQYQERVAKASGVQGVSTATVPLLTTEGTSGVLGFIKYGDRQWLDAEVNSLRALAALMAQLRSRVGAEEKLRFLAYHDELTGLSNRRALVDHLSVRLRSGAEGPVAAIFMDLDRLKAMNSFLGHAAGDLYLQTLAGRLDHSKGPGHFLARLGGDEFVLVLPGSSNVDDARVAAEFLRRVANEPVQVGGEEVSRGVSLGVALGTPGTTTVSELLSQADQAMLQAKSGGGNEISLFTEEMRIQNEIRTDIELHLGSAIRNGALVLHYQLEIDLRDGRITGVEALVRWQHPNLGLLQPNQFIGVSEATNLSGELGRWVIETGCRQLKQWHEERPALLIGLRVNVSPAQLITADFAETVAQILTDCELDGHFLTVEITEHAVVSDMERTLHTLEGLKKIGVQVAIDDFGTGYSSFAQLKTLPVDALKIDRAFVSELGKHANDLAIVRSIIGLAHSFDLRVVAEGVETPLASRVLLDLGCFRAQGFLFGVPGPAQEVELALAAGRVEVP